MKDQPTSLRQLRRASGHLYFYRTQRIDSLLDSLWRDFAVDPVAPHHRRPCSHHPAHGHFFQTRARGRSRFPTRWWSAALWSGIGWAALSLSGLWLVGKGIWGVFAPYRMHSVHLVAGLAFGAVGLFHVVYGVARSNFPRGRYAQLARPLPLCILIFAVGAVVIGISLRQETLAIGNFIPSNARTDTGRVIPAKLLIEFRVLRRLRLPQHNL